MDPEQTFIRVQERFSQVLTPRLRAALEYMYLFLAITLFCILVVMHANYVQQVVSIASPVLVEFMQGFVGLVGLRASLPLECRFIQSSINMSSTTDESVRGRNCLKETVISTGLG